MLSNRVSPFACRSIREEICYPEAEGRYPDRAEIVQADRLTGNGWVCWGTRVWRSRYLIDLVAPGARMTQTQRRIIGGDSLSACHEACNRFFISSNSTSLGVRAPGWLGMFALSHYSRTYGLPETALRCTAANTKLAERKRSIYISQYGLHLSSC